MQDILKDLNKEQKEAVTFGKGPLLIVAGAGTGKTTVITRRLAWLIFQGLSKPDEILALTFTDKAAGEMEERVDRLLPYGYVDLWVSTFHAFGERILKDHALEIGLSNDFKLLNEQAQWLLVRENLNEFNLDYFKPLGNPTKFIRALLRHFSRAKDENVTPEEYLRYAEEIRLNKDTDVPELSSEEAKRIEEIANAYHVYQKLLLENDALDFGDLINYTYKLFKERPLILDKYRRQFKYILVDEFQDTNWAQYELIKLLAAPQNNLTVVGDDDQCLPGNVFIDVKKGRKRIKDIKIGDEVITAVGKGHIGISKVSKIFKNKKRDRLLKIETAKGYRLTVTDNHKVFCYIPKISDREYYYVYLMYREDMGWRIGTTNDLAQRLKLEKSADKIIGIKAYSSEEEAKYYETLYSLKYGIPKGCFKERQGIILKDKWLTRLYQEIDIDSNVKKLADDLSIDLDAHHYCLAAVKRGSKSRIKINVELCHRRYRSKEHVKKEKLLILNPKIIHQVSIETSNKETIKKLKENGFSLTKAKKGTRLRIQNSDIKKINLLVDKLQHLTGGFIECKFKLGKIHYQHLPALVMPAKNLVLGHYLPVRKGKEIIYDKIIKISEKYTREFVYDLEIERTHNFIAAGIVVHNSIYKFRGASISNILEFKKDYAQSKEIILTKNYRSYKNILDIAYEFIQLNNPNRLEWQLNKTSNKQQTTNNLKSKVSKKLEAVNKGVGIIEHLHGETEFKEARLVVEKILSLKEKDKRLTWNDFAILVRANSYAEVFIEILSQAQIPYEFLASSGLYSKPIILDILSYLRLLDNYHESSALYRILNLPILDIPYRDITTLLYEAKKKSWSLFETLERSQVIGLPPHQCIGRGGGISEKACNEISKLLSLIKKHSALAREKNVARIIYTFLEDSGYLKFLTENENKNLENIRYLEQFFKKVQEFEKKNEEKKVKDFIETINLSIEAGEGGALQISPEEGPESVKILTIHGAKGLEFTYVFIVNLVDRRFPSTEKKEPIELPDALIKEVISQGDIHLQEERRLFYVACTRTKKGLFFTSAEDYGGQRKKKLSRFLIELGYKTQEHKNIKTQEQQMKRLDLVLPLKPVSSVETLYLKSLIPSRFSYTQLKAFETCPLQYKYAFILKIPAMGKGTISFGRTMHNTLERFFKKMLESKGLYQKNLFASEEKKETSPTPPSLNKLLSIYEECWIEDWYESKSHQEKYKKKGKEILKKFYKINENCWPKPKFLEKAFNLKIGDYSVRGAIDRIDELESATSDKQSVTTNVEIVDYKTGKVPEDEKKIDKDQLLIYQIAVEEILGLKPLKLTYYYLDENKKFSFLGKEKELDKLKEKIKSIIEEIKRSDFRATPSVHKCKYCDFNKICEFRII